MSYWTHYSRIIQKGIKYSRTHLCKACSSRFPTTNHTRFTLNTTRALAAAAGEKKTEPRLPQRRRINIYDESDNWEDWFSMEEYGDPWGEWLEPLDYKPLDNTTRFLIQCLQDMHNGLRIGWDRPTTERCNVAIRMLGDSKLGGKKLKGRAERAYVILKCMELFYPSQPFPQRQTSDEIDNRLDVLLPHPNHETYFGVLKLYATNTSHYTDSARVPQVCLDVMKRMQQRYKLELQNAKLAHLENMTINPHDIVLWNQVLSAWAICKHDEKAYEAARLLQQLEEDDNVNVDSSSYGHVLRACAFSDTSDRSKQLASKVALKVWSDFFKQGDLEPTSYMFTFYLQACQYIADRRRKDIEVEAAFAECCEKGMVNPHVLHAFKQAASKNLYNKMLKRVGITFNQKPNEPPISEVVLAQRVPHYWTRHANVKNQWGW